MDKEIRNAEISEEELESVSGGYSGEEYAPNCEKSGTAMCFLTRETQYYYACPNCNHLVRVSC